MATTTARPAALDPQQNGAHKAPLTVDDRCALLRHMLLMRATEERALTLYRQGKVPGSYYDGRGQEAVSVGSAFALVTARPRLHPAPRPRRAPRARREARSRAGPDDGPRRRSRPAARTATCTSATASSVASGMVSMLPDMALVACGLALAFQMRGEPRVAMTWFGDGLDRQRPVARGDERGRRAQAAGGVHPREQPVRLLDPQRPRVRRGPGAARRDLRLPGREGGRQRRGGHARRRLRGVRPRPRRRRARR